MVRMGCMLVFVCCLLLFYPDVVVSQIPGDCSDIKLQECGALDCSGLSLLPLVSRDAMVAVQLVPCLVNTAPAFWGCAETIGISTTVLGFIHHYGGSDEPPRDPEAVLFPPAARRFLAGPLPGRGGDPEGRVIVGELLPWPEANLLAPTGSIVTLVDVETGTAFQAKRRGGHLHMDMEPAGIQDTVNMSSIYGNKWSWERRAVLVGIGERVLAGSINGMPHGNAVLTGNNFPGHFCLHFLGSSIHRTGEPDPKHQAMVHKAAGELVTGCRQ